MSGEWRVIFVPRHGWDLVGWVWPYHVVGPSGSLETLTATLTGAKWKIRRLKAKHQRQLAAMPWWDQPTVYREAP